MKKTTKNIRVGYLYLVGEALINVLEINRYFSSLLSRYVYVKILPVSNVRELMKILKRIKKQRLDYLYIDTFNFLEAAFLLRERLQLDMPLIFTIHAVYNWENRYTYIIPLIRKYDIIISPSQYAKKSFLKISDKFRIEVVPLCLDTTYIQKNISYNFDNEKKIITFMGRLAEEKGVLTLIRCMPEIVAVFDNVHLNIIGPLSGNRIADYPKDRYVKRLEREIVKLGLRDLVHFKGVRFGLDKYRILSESDVFVNPTTMVGENFPMVNLEAFACGVPVITTKLGANKELIREGENGYLADINYDKDKKPEINTKQLISLVVKILGDRTLNHKLRRNAQRYARRYDYQVVIPRFIGLLKRKERIKIKNNWNIIKDKKVEDFNHLFNRDFLFFLHYFIPLRNKTYSSLYEKCLKEGSLDSEYFSSNMQGKSVRDRRIWSKMRRSYTDFITKI